MASVRISRQRRGRARRVTARSTSTPRLDSTYQDAPALLNRARRELEQATELAEQQPRRQSKEQARRQEKRQQQPSHQPASQQKSPYQPQSAADRANALGQVGLIFAIIPFISNIGLVVSIVAYIMSLRAGFQNIKALAGIIIGIAWIAVVIMSVHAGV